MPLTGRITQFLSWFNNLPVERFVALSMSAMALVIAFEPERGVAGFINRVIPNSSSYDFALILAISGLFLFTYDRSRIVVFTMTVPLWGYMLFSLPYVLSTPGAPPSLPVICFSYLYVISYVFHQHKVAGYYDHA